MSRTFTIRVPKDVENINYGDVLHLLSEVDTDRLFNKAWEICRIDHCAECGTELNEIISQYETLPTEDLTLRVYDYDEEITISQVASGGSQCRDMKEAARFAFITLFLEMAQRYAEHATLEVSF